MWRLSEFLTGQCVYLNQDVSFIGNINAKIHTIFVDGKQVCAYATSSGYDILPV